MASANKLKTLEDNFQTLKNKLDDEIKKTKESLKNINNSKSPDQDKKTQLELKITVYEKLQDIKTITELKNYIKNEKSNPKSNNLAIKKDIDARLETLTEILRENKILSKSETLGTWLETLEKPSVKPKKTVQKKSEKEKKEALDERQEEIELPNPAFVLSKIENRRDFILSKQGLLDILKLLADNPDNIPEIIKHYIPDLEPSFVIEMESIFKKMQHNPGDIAAILKEAELKNPKLLSHLISFLQNVAAKPEAMHKIIKSHSKNKVEPNPSIKKEEPSISQLILDDDTSKPYNDINTMGRIPTMAFQDFQKGKVWGGMTEHQPNISFVENENQHNIGKIVISLKDDTTAANAPALANKIRETMKLEHPTYTIKANTEKAALELARACKSAKPPIILSRIIVNGDDYRGEKLNTFLTLKSPLPLSEEVPASLSPENPKSITPAADQAKAADANEIPKPPAPPAPPAPAPPIPKKPKKL